MRTYILTTGTIFALIFLAHIARIFSEGTHLLSEPIWDLLTIMAAALSLWALRLLRKPTA